MADNTYNGWTNYETWCVSLWIDNEEGSYNYWREAAQEAWNEGDAPSANARLTGTEPFTRDEKAVLSLSRQLKEEFEAGAPDMEGVWADLLNAALSEVNWHEIAEHMIEDVDKSESEETADAE